MSAAVSLPHLDKIRELHSVVRDWIERTAVAQRNDDIRASLPYVDLMFAFGFATLGDHPTANTLTEAARRVMEGPIPEGGSPQAEQAVTAALVRNFLFKAFRYRVEQALAGKPHTGSLSAELLFDRDAIMKRGGSGPVNHPYKLAEFVIDRCREQGRILEPSERVDYYATWTKHGDPMKKALAQQHDIRDPLALAERIRNLYRDGFPNKSLKEVQFYVLHEGLPLAPRVGEAFALELLEHVPAVLQAGTGAATESPDVPRRQGELLERALFLAAHLNREDIVKKLVDDFTALVRSKPEDVRFKLINVVARQCMRSLKKLGLQHEIDRFLTQLFTEVLEGKSFAELREKHSTKPEAWAAALQTLLHLAGGWMDFGLHDRAAPILAEARTELLACSVPLQPKDYTELARAYVATLGHEPSVERGLSGMVELFTKVNPWNITNTWTTAQYYSRFHLCLVEDTVFAVCELCATDPAPAIVSA